MTQLTVSPAWNDEAIEGRAVARMVVLFWESKYGFTPSVVVLKPGERTPEHR